MRVLIAEDDPVSRQVLQKLLAKRGYEVVATCDGTEAWEVLQSPDSPLIAILDWMMPGMSGIEICKALRERGRESYTYVILLTARSRKEDLLIGLHAGADDYLVKPFDTHELEMRLRVGERIIDLQKQLIASREELRHEAMHDSLTGVYNRRAIDDVLLRELARAQRTRSGIAVVMVDIDRFKRINDAVGHPAGDRVLREVSHRIQSALRLYDLVGRYGGEEFLLILPETDEKESVEIAERLRKTVAAERIETPKGPIRVAVSLGVAGTDHARTVDAETLIVAADAALYRAKAAGRNRVEVEPWKS